MNYVRLALIACALALSANAGAGEDETFTSALQQIHDYYLDPVSLEALSLAAINAVDPSGRIKARDDNNRLVLEVDGREVRSARLPGAEDVSGWAGLDSAFLATARERSSDVRALSEDALFARAMTGMITKLDPFTRYADAEQARRQRDARDGFGGVGLTLSYESPEPRVLWVHPEGPAAHAGIRPEDRLEAIDGRPTAGLGQDQIIPRLRGPVATRVALSIERPSARRQHLEIAFERALIVPPSVSMRLADDLAIVSISLFNAHTAEELRQALHSVIAHRPAVKGFVLDLRGNPGGLLDQAASVVSLFVNHGVAVTTRGRNPSATQSFSARGSDSLHGMPMVVLVDGDSASSAEIVAAALQDQHRAQLIGTSSFGKGTVQIVLPLANAGELTLTWARIYAPAGYALHGHGVVPTFCVTHAPSHPANESDRARSVIDDGLHASKEASVDRAKLDEDGWRRLRASCPPTVTEDDGLPLAVARELLRPHGESSATSSKTARSKRMRLPHRKPV